MSKSDCGFTSIPTRCLITRASRRLLPALTRAHAAWNPVVGQRFEADQLLFEVPEPAISDPVADQRAQFGIAERDPPPRRHAVGHVDDALGVDRVEIVKHRLLEELGVQRGNAVDGMAADAREVRHPDRLVSRLVDDRKTPNQRVVARAPAPHVIEETLVDLEDDLQVARQQRGKQRQRPLLQRLGQEV